MSLELALGECLVVVGANGSGKSTLLRVIAGVTRPVRGIVELFPSADEEIVFGAARGRPDALAPHVGLAAPEIELYGELTAVENLAFFARVRGLAAPRAGILERLAEVGLVDRADDRLGSFSSGMKQRLRLLFAVQHAPALLLLDEPGSNLDAEGKQFVAVIVEKQLQRGALILATNDPMEIQFGHQLLTLGPAPMQPGSAGY